MKGCSCSCLWVSALLFIACDGGPFADTHNPDSMVDAGTDAAGTDIADAREPRSSCAGRWHLDFTVERSSCGNAELKSRTWIVEQALGNRFEIALYADDAARSQVVDEAGGRSCHFRFEDNGKPDLTNDIVFVAYYDVESSDARTVTGTEIDIITRLSDEAVLCELNIRIGGEITD